MKKILLSLFLISISAATFAKQIKFAVDMTGQVLSPNGIHVMGDFQTIAGFAGGDWNPASTTLTQEGTTDIYSIIIDIPAFTKYEYKYVNGDQSYEAEFIPEPSRVGYNFNDNRWLYLDSLANDTTFIGALIFGGNAPAGLKLVRFYVDMQNEVVSSNGVHVGGTFQGTNPWSASSDIMYSFGGTVYELIKYVNIGVCNFKFYNGNTVPDAENIPGACSVFGNREVDVQYDTLLTNFCFASCVSCVVGLNENAVSQNIILNPNPAHNYSVLQFDNSMILHSVSVCDISGRVVRKYQNFAGKNLIIEKENLESGIYIVNVINDWSAKTIKLIFE